MIAGPSPQKTILLASSDRVERQTLNKVLQEAGYQVVAAKDSGSFWAAQLKHNAALVILDASLDGDDGFSVCMQLRSIPVTHYTPVLMILNEDRDIDQALDAGISDCMRRPIHRQLLLRRIDHLIKSTRVQNPPADAVAEYERKYRHLFDSANDAIFIVDMFSGYLLDANRQAVRWFGYSYEELVGMHIDELKGPKPDVAKEGEVMRQLTTRGNLVFEDNYRAKNGTFIPMEVSSRITTYDGRRALLNFARDIRERKRIEQAEVEQRKLAQALTDSAMALSKTLSLDEVINRVLDQIAQVVPSDAASVMLLEEDGMLRIIGQRGHMQDVIDGEMQTLIEDVSNVANLQWMLDELKPLIIGDTRTYDGWINVPGMEWIRSYLGVPIMVEDDVIGFLSLDSKDAYAFASIHAEKVLAFASQASIAIRNALLYQRIERHADDLKAEVTLRTRELVAANRVLREQISERERIEARLAEERNLLRILIDNIPDDIYAKDTAGKFILVNKPLEERLSAYLTEGGVVGTDNSAYMPREIAEERSAQERHIIETGDAIISQQVSVMLRDGSTRYQLSTKVPLRNSQGEIIGLIGINRDITERKEWETALQRAHDRLEQRVMERTLELSHAHTAEREQRRMAEALAEAAAGLSQTLNLAELLDRFLTVLARVMPPHTMASIMLIEDDIFVRALRTREHTPYGFKTSSASERFFLDSLPNLRRILEAGGPVIIPEMGGDFGWATTEDGPPLESYLGAPIYADGKVIGFINLGSTQQAQFSPDDAEHLRPFADQAGIAIQNALLYEAVQQHASELSRRVMERTQELETERAQLRAILDAMIEGVIFYDEDGQPQYINRSLAQLTGYDEAEWLQTRNYLQMTDVTDSERVRLYYNVQETLLRTGIWRGEVRMRRKDGEEFDANLVATRVLGADGQSAGSVIVLREISQEKRLETQKSRFIANASHELRTPITNLKTRLYLISRQPEKLDVHLRIMETVTDRMQHLVEDLLDISRFDNGMISLNMHETHLQDLVSSVTQIQRDEAARKAIILTERLAPEPLLVMADSSRLTQVITNLVTNAINYTQEGGTVSVIVEPDEDSGALVHVEDTGVGIAPELLPNIFKPFIRGSEQSTGAGLGLSITKEIVELHQGEITISSEPGRGSRFTVRLGLAGSGTQISPQTAEV